MTTNEARTYVGARRYPRGGAIVLRLEDVDALPTDIMANSFTEIVAANYAEAKRKYVRKYPRSDFSARRTNQSALSPSRIGLSKRASTDATLQARVLGA